MSVKMSRACFSDGRNAAGTSSVLEISVPGDLQSWPITPQYIHVEVLTVQGGQSEMLWTSGHLWILRDLKDKMETYTMA